MSLPRGKSQAYRRFPKDQSKCELNKNAFIVGEKIYIYIHILYIYHISPNPWFPDGPMGYTPEKSNIVDSGYDKNDAPLAQGNSGYDGVFNFSI